MIVLITLQTLKMKGLTFDKKPIEYTHTYKGHYTIKNKDYEFFIIVVNTIDNKYIECVNWIGEAPENDEEILEEIEYYFTIKYKHDVKS
jgi:hypothetical protein